MSPRTAALRTGLHRGWIEFRQVLAAGEIMGWLWPSAVALIVLYFLRDKTVPGTTFSLGAQTIPGFLGMNVVFTGMLGMSVAFTTERDDGTLLRMKAVPNGMLGYLTGRVSSQATLTTAVLLIVLIPAAFIFDGLRLGTVSAWLMLLGLLALGLLATLPLGAVIGSLFKNVQSLSVISLIFMGVTAISGIFYPITALPGWLQWVGQAFPVYWLGLGMRSAMLPEAMAAVEIGQSWRHLETVGVLGAWTVLGFALAPVMLRRIARRSSGSPVPAAPAASGQRRP